MVAYDLSHLTQPDHQFVLGPIQDDEALFLYGMIRGMRLRRVLEIGGGMTGYSAQTLCRAVGPHGRVYTVDVNPVPKVADNHTIILKDAAKIAKEDVEDQPLDLVFFDCHDYDAQMLAFLELTVAGLITPRTVIALHDTNLHYQQVVDFAYELPGRPGCWVHQHAERSVVNTLVHEHGYHAFNLHTGPEAHADGSLPVRHGLTLCQKFETLDI